MADVDVVRTSSYSNAVGSPVPATDTTARADVVEDTPLAGVDDDHDGARGSDDTVERGKRSVQFECVCFMQSHGNWCQHAHTCTSAACTYTLLTMTYTTHNCTIHRISHSLNVDTVPSTIHACVHMHSHRTGAADDLDVGFDPMSAARTFEMRQLRRSSAGIATAFGQSTKRLAVSLQFEDLCMEVCT